MDDLGCSAALSDPFGVVTSAIPISLHLGGRDFLLPPNGEVHRVGELQSPLVDLSTLNHRVTLRCWNSSAWSRSRGPPEGGFVQSISRATRPARTPAGCRSCRWS